VRRGDIYLVAFDPATGSEPAKTRPAVIVSNNRANDIIATTGHGVLTVVPLTSNLVRVYPFQVRVPAARRTGLSTDSKAQAELIRGVDVRRLGRRLGTVSVDTLTDIDQALRLHLVL